MFRILYAILSEYSGDDVLNAYIIDCMALRHNISDQNKVQSIESTAKVRSW